MCIFKQVQNDLFIYLFIFLFCRFRLSLQIYWNANLFISYNSWIVSDNRTLVSRLIDSIYFSSQTCCTCCQSTTKALGKCIKYVQSQQQKTPKRHQMMFVNDNWCLCCYFERIFCFFLVFLLVLMTLCTIARLSKMVVF